MENVIKYINTNALINNTLIIKDKNPQSMLCAVVKSKAYGHNTKIVVNSIKNIVDYFAVISLSEAIHIKSQTTTPVLIISPLTYKEKTKAIKNNIEISIFNKQDAIDVCKISEQYNHNSKVHIKLDTGMHRLGINNLTDFIQIIDILQHNNVHISGIFTHIGSGKCKRSTNQINKFNNFCQYLPQSIIQHYSNSETTFNNNLKNNQMARVGISIYGYGDFNNLQPVMSVYSKIISITTVEKDDYIGYGNNHKANKNMRLAIINIGYANGLMRNYAKDGYFIINNKKAKIVANICMNMTIVDITNIENVEIGQWAIIIGKSKNLCITAQDIADKCNTISYEILTNFSNIPITKKVPKTYTDYVRS